MTKAMFINGSPRKNGNTVKLLNRAMEMFLFENLRIEVGDFRNLDFDFIEKVAPLYRKKNLQILSKMR